MTKNELRKRIDERSILPKELAKMTGVKLRTVHRWLDGSRKIPGHVPILFECMHKFPGMQEFLNGPR